MTNKTLKIIAGFALVLSLATPALAVAPLVLTALELAATEIVLDNGIKFLMPESATPNMPKTGNATSTGVNRNLLARVGTTAALAVTGFIAYSELKQLVGNPLTSSGQAHPALSAAIHQNLNQVQPFTIGASKDSVYFLGGAYLKVVAVYPAGYTSNSVAGQVNRISTYQVQAFGPADSAGIGYCRAQMYDVVPVSAPAANWTERPDTEIAPLLNSPTLNELYPSVLADVDNVIKANPSALQVSGTLSSDVLDAQKQLAIDTQKQASAARVASLKEVRDARQAAYDANPTPENKEALDKAEAEYQEALADDAELTLNSAKDAEADSPLSPPEPPEYDTINFQPLVDMGEELGDKFPFSLLATLKNFATGLVTTPRAPAFDITFPAPFNHTWHVSLDRFDGIAQMVRVLIGMAFLGYCTMAIIRRWQ